MITISNLKGDHSAIDQPAVHATAPVTNTQAFKGFTRRLLVSKNLILATSSVGGKVQINTDELWKLIEAADPKMVIPENIKMPTRKK